MVSVVNWQPTGGLMVQADRHGPKVGGHLAPCCTLRVNQGELSQYFTYDDSTINIVLVLLLLLLMFNKFCLNYILLQYIFGFINASVKKQFIMPENYPFTNMTRDIT